MWKYIRLEMLNSLEIPFTSSTVLDATIKGPSTAIQKYRQELTKSIDPGVTVSLGRAGTVRLLAVPLIDCTAVAVRWRSVDAEMLRDAYMSAGLGRLFGLKVYRQALELSAKAIAEAGIQRDEFSSRRISHCISILATERTAVREVASRMSEITRKVDLLLGEMRRLVGRIVRNEGDRTVVSILNGDVQELRSADSKYLHAMGVQGPGASFSIHQFEWSPDSTMNLYFPAVDLDQSASVDPELAEMLRAAERPLPEPENLPRN
jgi:tetrahydromethanopterin S-methyltransferase subunit G